MDEKRLAYVGAVKAVTVKSADLLRTLGQQMPNRTAQGSESFGTLSIHRVAFEPGPSTPPPTVEAAAMFRLLALFAWFGSNPNYGWRLPETPDEWEESVVANVASTQPRGPIESGFGFELDQFRLR